MFFYFYIFASLFNLCLYYWIWLFFKLPILVIIGILLFPFVEKRIFNNSTASMYYLTLLLSFFLILFIFIFKNVAVYDELRHVLFLVPMIFLIGLTNLYYFMIVAFITGSFLGLYEIAMNLRASDIEKNNKKSMMSGFHAFYSLGLLIGASITSLFVELEISFLTNIIVVVLILLPLNIIFAKLLGEDLKPEDNEGKKNIFFFMANDIIRFSFNNYY